MIIWQDTHEDFIEMFKRSVKYDFDSIKKPIYTGLYEVPNDSTNHKFVSDIISAQYVDLSNKCIRQLKMYRDVRAHVSVEYRHLIMGNIDEFYSNLVASSLNREYSDLVILADIEKYLKSVGYGSEVNELTKEMYDDNVIIDIHKNDWVSDYVSIYQLMMCRAIPNEAVVVLIMDM